MLTRIPIASPMTGSDREQPTPSLYEYEVGFQDLREEVGERLGWARENEALFICT